MTAPCKRHPFVLYQCNSGQLSLVGNDPIVRKSVLDVYMNKRYDTIKTAEKELANDAG